MKNRTILKEGRNTDFTLVWAVISFIVWIVILFKYGRSDETLVLLILSQFCFLSYRVLTYGFNSLLLLFCAKKFKINRLKDKVSPIYKIEGWEEYFKIKKYSVYYTKLDLKWSVPFSVLFEEQEYLYDGEHAFISVPKDIAIAWEAEESKKRDKMVLEITQKHKKQQKLDKLNKIFLENYE